MTPDAIRARLDAMAEPAFQVFQARLIPTLPPERILGVRTPQLRRFARELSCLGGNEAFLAALPHATLEESTLHGFLIERMRDFDACLAALEAFLPHIDNWATCDLVSPKVLGKHLPELLPRVLAWIQDGRPFVTRYGLGMLQRYWLAPDTFRPELLTAAAQAPGNDYYVGMMKAWFFATALTLQYDAALPYLTACRLDSWVHNKAIQKCCESLRIPPERKTYLRTLRR